MNGFTSRARCASHVKGSSTAAKPIRYSAAVSTTTTTTTTRLKNLLQPARKVEKVRELAPLDVFLESATGIGETTAKTATVTCVAESSSDSPKLTPVQGATK